MMRAGTTLVGTAVERGGLAPIRAGQLYAERDTGALYVADETPAWQYYPSLIPGPMTVEGDITLYDGVGDSPSVYWRGASGEQTRLYFDDTLRSFVLVLEDDKAEAMRIIDDGDANDYLTFVTDNTQREVVFNQDGADIDTRIEAVGKTNALFVRGSDGLVGFGSVPTAQVDIAAAAAAGFTLQTSFDNSGNCWRMWRAGLYSATMTQIAGTQFTIANNASYITAAWAFDGQDTHPALKLVLNAWDGDFCFDIAPANPAGAPVFDTKVVIKSNGDAIFGGTNPTAQLHVDQSSATGAQPVLLLDQADVSEEMIEFVCTIGVGNAIEAAGGKTLTATHFIKVTLPGPLTRYIPVGTIA